MSVLNLPSSRASLEVELEQLSTLAVKCSERLTGAPLEDIGQAIGETLEQVAAITRTEACQLVEFTALGAVAQEYLPARASLTSEGRKNAAPGSWLLERLARGEVVAISRPDELPFDAIDARERIRRTGLFAVLGVPGMVAGRVVCAIIADTSRLPRRWPPPLIERFRLLAQTFGAALRRLRHEEHPPAANTVERLNTLLEVDNAYLKEELKSYHDFDEIVGDSTPLRDALTRVAQVANTNATVLLTGPTGAGKELFARAVHERSRRHSRPLVRVNCAALPPTLVESELFGHEKGAFTGAVSARQGRFELADGGTIFLDEIGDLSPEVQVKFLRVLQEGEFERVGSSRTTRVDVRVIAATHRDLEREVAEGHFRSDLYYRLSVYPIRVPSLLERVEDIPQLVWFFINRRQRELGRRITKVPSALMEALKHHNWPGNVRELENVVERAMIATSGDTLQLDDALPFGRRIVAAAPAADNLDDVQRAHIAGVLERCGWRINGTGNAAERLGIHPNTLRFRIKKLGVVCPNGRGRQQQRLTPE